MEYKKVLGVGTGILLTFILLAAFFPSLQNSGQALTDEGMCDAATTTCFYNASRTITCTEYNTTAADTTICAASNYVSGGLPSSSMLGTSGVIWTLLGVMVLVAVIVLIVGWMKHKK